MIQKINLREAFTRIPETWSPRIAGAVNDAHVKLARLEGAFEWHHHPDEDELFLVVQGRMTLHLRDGDVDLEEGEFAIVPRGVEHLPEAPEECHVLLFEPAGTLNTGNLRNDQTIEDPEPLGS